VRSIALKTLRAIRPDRTNPLLISKRASSFDHEEVSSRCFNFTLVDKYVIDPDNKVHGDANAFFGYIQPGAAQKLKVAKDRYELSAQIFSMGLQHATVEAKPYTPAF